MFIFDIILNFRTTYIDTYSGKEIFERNRIAWNYIVSPKFTLDIVSSMPLDLLAKYAFEDDSGTWSLFRLFKLVRVLRLSKVVMYMRA